MKTPPRVNAVPLLSFVVIAYNVEDSIARCLCGLRAQLSTVAEVIVVDDASIDGTLTAINSAVEDDPRFRVISKCRNEGPHLARRTGVELSSGRYVYFVDGDDEVSAVFCDVALPFMQSHEADIYRFGIDVVACGDKNKASAASTASVFNASRGVSEGADILARSFSDDCEQQDTWSVTVCAYNGDFCRAAWKTMVSERLGYMEDAYEFFVLASRARRLINCTDIHMLKYYFGAGRSGYGSMSRDSFEQRQREIKVLVECVQAYVSDSCMDSLARYACWLEERCLLTISNEWVTRLSLGDQLDVIPALVDTWGVGSVLHALVAPLMGRARWVLEDCSRLDDMTLIRWRSVFEPLMEASDVAFRHDEKTSILIELLRQIDDHRTARDRDVRERLELEMARESVFPRRVLNALLPRGSKIRRALSAVVRELSS